RKSKAKDAYPQHTEPRRVAWLCGSSAQPRSDPCRAVAEECRSLLSPPRRTMVARGFSPWYRSMGFPAPWADDRTALHRLCTLRLVKILPTPVLSRSHPQMPAQILDGKSLAQDYRAKIAARVKTLRAQNRAVRLDAILVDTGNPGARQYAESQGKTCRE